jgi:hypothetical protein
MEEQGPRYAVYFIPAADSDLYRFGSAVLQYDCYRGRPVPAPEDFEAEAETWRQLTEEPRRYGFHATLKAPFHLNASSTEDQLVSAVKSFAALGRRPPRIMPAVQMLSGFTALVPARANPAVDGLAADCTTIFDGFRAPMSAQERARRLASGLDRSQIQNLDRWGYPYLFADFRFHMTLTGKIEVERRDRTLAVLQTVFRRMCGNDEIVVDRLAVVKQQAAGEPFYVLSHVTLG